MLRKTLRTALVGFVSFVGTASLAVAQIGQPSGSFQITVNQGNGIVANHTVTIGPGGDLVDLQPVSVDGTPEDFTRIGTLGPSGSPIILKVTTDGDASFRMMHLYIDAPISLADIHSAGPTSLFDPLGGNIGVTISGLSFDNLASARPFICDNNSYMVSFMRDIQGHFYELPSSLPDNAYSHGINDIQVPGEIYLDGTADPYNFTVLQDGQSSSWAWENILNPGLSTTVNNGLADGVAPLSPGYVFELGLSVAFVAIPEPGTLALLLLGLVPLGRRLARRDPKP